MERLHLYEYEANIDGVESGPTTQAEVRAKKVEFYKRQRPLGALRLPEVVIEQVEVTQQSEEGEQ